MNREEFLEDLPLLFGLHRESGGLEYKVGGSDDPGDSYDRLIAVGWVKLTDEGGPWRHLTITPEGEALIERLFQASELAL